MNESNSKIEHQLTHFLKLAFSKENSRSKVNVKIRQFKTEDIQDSANTSANNISGEFIGNIHSEYSKYYSDWLIAYIKLSICKNDSLMESSMRLFFPFKDENGYFSWSMLKVFPSCHKDAICLNIQITYLSKRFQAIFLPGEIWCKGNIEWDLTKQLHQKYKDQNGFKFTKNQQKIIELYTLNPDYTHQDLADILSKAKNTIDVQCKQIVKKSSEYYGIKFKNTKGFVNYLSESNHLL